MTRYPAIHLAGYRVSPDIRRRIPETQFLMFRYPMIIGVPLYA